MAEGRRSLASLHSPQADVRGHHMAVLCSNEANCRRQMGDLEGAIKAANEGMEHYSTRPESHLASDSLDFRSF